MVAADAGSSSESLAGAIPTGLPYPLVVRDNLLSEAGTIVQQVAPAHAYAIITDENVGPLYTERVQQSFGSARCAVFTMRAGESNKVVGTWAELSEMLFRQRFGRDTVVIALGGGIVGDVAGFVAATYMRGVPYVQVPTTVVAMVDASIGGKTGVNTESGKNLLGAFHQPRAVLADPTTLGSLPPAELRAGLAEVIKHGAIADADYLATVEAELENIVTAGGRSAAMNGIIARSIGIKANVVAQDEREAGLRKILNFGHTIGHAIEACSGYTLLHGEAVGIGMLLETEASERAGITEPGTCARIRNALTRVGLPVRLPAGMSAEAVLNAAATDKKARAGELELAVPLKIGSMAGANSGWAVKVPRDLLIEVLS